jgi:hypothetical protein
MDARSGLGDLELRRSGRLERRWRRRLVRVPLVEHRDAAADALEGTHALTLEPDEDGRRVLVRAPPDLVGVRVPLGHDLLAPDLRGAGQLPLLDEEGCLLLGAREDALGLLLGALHETGRLLVDALRLADLLGHRHAQLVHQVEGSHLIHDHGVGHGHATAVRDEGLEAFDEEDDVDGSGLAGEWRRTARDCIPRRAIGGRRTGGGPWRAVHGRQPAPA